MASDLTGNDTVTMRPSVLNPFTGFYNNATEAWTDLYYTLSDQGLSNDSRDGEVCGELINPRIIIADPTRNFVKSPIRNLSVRYAVGEFLWYISGSNKLSDIAQFSSTWNGLSDDGETVNSAYGYRILEKFGFNQLEYVYRLLKEHPDTRQAVIHIKDASRKVTNDVPCTVYLQYFIREGKLHAITNMRSNDIWMGFPYDVFSFTNFQIFLAMRLGIPVGCYMHNAGSLHLYSRDKQGDVYGQSKGVTARS